MSRELPKTHASPNGKTLSHAGKGLKSTARPASKNHYGKLRLTVRAPAATLVDDSDEANDSEGIEDEQTTDANDEDVVAPSSRPVRARVHQTGLSVSLSNASIAGTTRKRTWSNRVQEEDDMVRPVKVAKEESTSSDSSDEDSDTGYENIDLISESGEDDTEREEEQMIIESEEDDNDDEEEEDVAPSSPGTWEGFDMNPISEETSHFMEHFERTNTAREDVAKVTRKVRFVDEVVGASTSSSNSEDSEDDFFPDLLIQQDQLDPRFRAILEKDSDSEGSYWDLAFAQDDAVDESEEEEGSSSGYESDEGETTDEEILPPPTIRPQSSQNGQTKSPARTPQKSPGRHLITPRSSANRQGPSLASWTVDPGKPYAIVDKTGSNMIFYPAQRPQSRDNTNNGRSRSGSIMNPNATPTSAVYNGEVGEGDEVDLHLQSPATLMLSGLTGNSVVGEGRFGSNVVGPPEAFFPWRSINSNGLITHDDDNDDQDYDDDADDLDLEDNLDINDFIDFGDSSGSDGGCDVDEEEASISEQPTCYNATAFRRNQLRVQGMTRRSRPFKTDNAVKAGRQNLANQLISPLRRQKPRNALALPPSTRKIATVSN